MVMVVKLESSGIQSVSSGTNPDGHVIGIGSSTKVILLFDAADEGDSRFGTVFAVEFPEVGDEGLSSGGDDCRL